MTNEADIQPKRLEMHWPRWSSPLLSLGLLAGGGYFLLRWSGGLPPLPWQLLFNALTHFSLIWQIRGGTIWLPLILLALHSLFLLVAWLSFCVCAYAAILALFSSLRQAPVAQAPAASSTTFPITGQGVYGDNTPYQYAATAVLEEPPTIPLPEQEKEDGNPFEDENPFEDLFEDLSPETRQTEKAATKLVMRIAARSHPGLEKRHMLKEDRLFVQQWPSMFQLPQPGGLFVVASCSGPFASGLEANRQIIQTISDTIIPALGTVQDPERLARHLLQGIQHAIFTYQLNSTQPTSIAVSVALIMGETAYLFHPGKSLSYLYTATEDQLRTLGHAQNEEAGEDLADVPLLTLPLQARQCLLLCSDGLWETVPEQEIASVLRQQWFQPERATHTLIEGALQRGGDDNISLILLSFEHEEAQPDEDDIFADIFRDEGL